MFCCCGVYEKPIIIIILNKVKTLNKEEIEFSEDCEIDESEKEKEFHKIKVEVDEKKVIKNMMKLL